MAQFIQRCSTYYDCEGLVAWLEERHSQTWSALKAQFTGSLTRGLDLLRNVCAALDRQIVRLSTPCSRSFGTAPFPRLPHGLQCLARLRLASLCIAYGNALLH